MKLTINGRAEKLTTPLNVADLLRYTGQANMKVAVARNGGFVPRAAYEKTELQDGDDIEIVAPMQGG